MINVLHITPHLNGGIGRVMLSTLKRNFYTSANVKHRIVLTEPLSDEPKIHFGDYLSLVRDAIPHEQLQKEMAQADILQIEWWNHPLIYKMLYTYDLPRCRLVLSSHVSGFHRPQIINKNIIDFSDLFLCTTRATSQHQVILEYNQSEVLEKLAFVRYPVDLDRFNGFMHRKHEGINVGYIGTLDYSKLHPNFLKMSADVNAKDVKFLVCGADNNDQIKNEAKKFQQTNFEFLGYQSDIKGVFEKLDIFAYPLNKAHYGSGEQVIIEAMYAGLPVVAFSNPAEKEIIRNGETGILVNSEKEYSEAIERLCFDVKLRKKLGKNAHEDIKKNLSPEACFNELEITYHNVMERDKRHRRIKPAHKSMPINGRSDPHLGAKLFTESLGLERNYFAKFLLDRHQANAAKIDKEISQSEHALKVKTKGSIFQYLYYFPNDQYLNFWCGLIDISDGRSSSAIKKFKMVLKGPTTIYGVESHIKRAQANL